MYNERRQAKRSMVVLASVILLGMSTSTARADEPVDFNADIRPILSDKCFACHGPEETHREGGFRLDVKDSAFGESDSGERPIVAGSPQESAVVARITSDDPDLRMPPADTKKPLTAEEIELIRRWIEQGAAWQEHWSLVPPARPPLPEVRRADWPFNEIDYFILARLEREKLQPSPEADKATLLRRVTLDLTGLPPTPAELDAFLKDESPDAYEKVVDRLLQSQHYGEHRARFWLDAARYGDTHGLHLDNYREMWPYRDWVINAYNRNLPYDQFVIDQLAGDLLPEPTPEQLIATGFNRAHVTTNEGGSIKEEVFVRNVVDRVVTFGTVFMGLTLECTRCHDHKYDPLTMRDFYSLSAYFNSLDGDPLDGNRKDPAPVLRVVSQQQQQQLDDLDAKIASLEARLREPWAEIDELQVAWEQQLAAAGNVESSSAADVLAMGDWYWVGPFNDTRSYLVRRNHGPEGKAVDLDEQFKLATGETVGWQRRADWVDGQPHSDLPGDTAANFVYRTITSPKERKVTVSLGSDDGIKVYLNGKEVLDKDVERAVAADQESLELTLKEGENHLLLKIMNFGGASGFYFSLPTDQPAIPADILQLVQLPAGERADEQQQTLRDFFRSKVATAPALDEARQQLAQLRENRAELDRQIPTTLIWRETAEPRPARLLKRGEYDQPGDEVPRSTPAVLPPLNADLPNNRLGLARWLVDPQHPLTARVAVNRYWQQIFGTGLVKTAEDFGSQGQPPSHPQLLDWLAVQFVSDGWDIQGTIKRIVMSATYRQSSHVTPQLYQRDPANRLLARGPRFRLDAEMLRDQALHVAGLLSDRIGGPSVKPPQPDGLWFAVGYSGSNTVRFVADQGHDKVHRRTLYTFIKRTAPPPQMSTFDAPSREACTVRRERTNTPLQALLLFNDPQYVEAARGLAERAMREGGAKARSRAEFMFRVCTGRTATDEELEDLVAGYQQDLDTYRTDPAAAEKLLEVGELPRDERLDASELAAWTVTANMLLNLDEVLNKN